MCKINLIKHIKFIVFLVRQQGPSNPLFQWKFRSIRSVREGNTSLMQIIYHLNSEHCFKYLLYFISLSKMLWTKWSNINYILYSVATLFKRLDFKYFNSEKVDNVFSPIHKCCALGPQCSWRIAAYHEFTSMDISCLQPSKRPRWQSGNTKNALRSKFPTAVAHSGRLI